MFTFGLAVIYYMPDVLLLFLGVIYMHVFYFMHFHVLEFYCDFICMFLHYILSCTGVIHVHVLTIFTFISFFYYYLALYFATQK